MALYVLNEGNMGTNKATLDRLDYASGRYVRDVYPQVNPTEVLALGDVGNDLRQYGGRLYAVVNCSHKVEVMDAVTARRIGQVDVPNCRSLAFDGGYAYVTSYAGPVSLVPTFAQEGYVAKIDTATLTVVATCPVGYQPEDMAIVDHRLYVANSGGYMAPDYDSRLSVIDLTTFRPAGTIDVAPNLHHVVADRRGQLWVSSRGNYDGTASALYRVDPASGRSERIDVAVGSMAQRGDSLYVVANEWNNATQRSSVSYAVVNTATSRIDSRSIVADDTETAIRTPYAIALHPTTGHIYITDARDYVSPGSLHCFSADGHRLWSVRTGDIPGHLAFVRANSATHGSGATGDDTPSRPADGASPYISRVFSYRPAPGQFVGLLPASDEGDDAESMRQKVEDCIGHNRRHAVTLGGWGGSVTFGFDHMVENRHGERDFTVLGNAYAGNSEAGIVEVSHDTNGNGLPDDEWYELAGSAYTDPATRHDYSVTYHATPADHVATTDAAQGYLSDTSYIRWTDSEGAEGYVAKNVYHTQDYFPRWLGVEALTFRGCRLPDNAHNTGSDGKPHWVMDAFSYGYADNAPNDTDAAALDIGWAVDAHGRPVNLPGIHFVRVTTGLMQQCGWLGESSTEIVGATDLHLVGEAQ